MPELVKLLTSGLSKLEKKDFAPNYLLYIKQQRNNQHQAVNRPKSVCDRIIKTESAKYLMR